MSSRTHSWIRTRTTANWTPLPHGFSHLTYNHKVFSLSFALSPSLPPPFINLTVSFVDAIQERNGFRAFKIIPEPSIIGNYIFHWEVTCHFSYFTSSEPIWEGNHHYDIWQGRQVAEGIEWFTEGHRELTRRGGRALESISSKTVQLSSGMLLIFWKKWSKRKHVLMLSTLWVMGRCFFLSALLFLSVQHQLWVWCQQSYATNEETEIKGESSTLILSPPRTCVQS